MAGRVLVVGSLNVDLVVTVDRMPDSGETVFGQRLDQHPGGKGLNQAVAAARMGAAVAMVGALGDDASGEWLSAVLDDEGIVRSEVARVPGSSGTALIEVDASGANRIVVVSGANATVDPAHVVAAIGEADGIAVVLAQGELPPEAVAAAMAGGRASGAVTVLNPAPAFAFSSDVLANVDYLIPNEHEAALLADRPTQTLDDASAAAVALVGLGVTCAIVTRGSQGLVWATADDSGVMSAFTVDAIDTVAAGDAFCGAFAAALAEGLDLKQAMRWASAAGALATTVAGAVPSLPTRESVQVLLDA